MAGRSCLQPAVPESPVPAKRQPQAGIRQQRWGPLGVADESGSFSFLGSRSQEPLPHLGSPLAPTKPPDF